MYEVIVDLLISLNLVFNFSKQASAQTSTNVIPHYTFSDFLQLSFC